jgi:hypothetical protein
MLFPFVQNYYKVKRIYPDAWRTNWLHLALSAMKDICNPMRSGDGENETVIRSGKCNIGLIKTKKSILVYGTGISWKFIQKYGCFFLKSGSRLEFVRTSRHGFAQMFRSLKLYWIFFEIKWKFNRSFNNICMFCGMPGSVPLVFIFSSRISRF